MAVDQLNVDIVAKPFPFQQQASFNASRYSTVPWGQAIVNETFDTPSIGAGNTGLINIDVDLPADYVAMMRTFHLGLWDTADFNWFDAVVGLAYQTPGGPYKNSVTEFPEREYQWYQIVRDKVDVKDRFASNVYYGFWYFGTETGSSNFNKFQQTPFQTPLWVPPTVDTSFKARQMIIYVQNDNASQPSAEMTLQCSFDLYTFEQAYSAAVMSSPRVFP